MKYYTLQSCDETKYPSITNLYWNNKHPYEGLFVTIDEIYKGGLIEKSKIYKLISTEESIISSNIPRLILADFQSCNSSNKYLYKNCKTGEYRIFVFSLHPPLRSTLKINGDCEVWERDCKIQDTAIRIRRASDNAELDIGFDVDENLNENTIKEFGGYNLLGYTEDVTNNSFYAKSRSIITEYGTFNGNKVFKIVENTNDNDEHFLQATLDNAGNNIFYNFSVVVKADTRDRVKLAIFMPGVKVGAQHYNLANGTIIDTNDPDNFASGIEPLADGFYKIYLTVQSGTNTLVRTQLVLLDNNNAETYVGNGKGLLISGLQLEVSNQSPKTYQPRLQGGASDCFITTWYNQFSSNHATQTIATNQPKIYDVVTGEVTKENGKPAMVFDGVNDKLESISNIIGPQPNSIAAVAARKGGTNSIDYLFDGTNGKQIVMISQNDYRLFSGNTIISSNSSDTNQHLFLAEFGLTTDKLFIDSIEVASGNAGSNDLGKIIIGGSADNNNHILDGVIQEILIYKNNLSESDRFILHDNLKKFYFDKNDNIDNEIPHDNLIAAFSLRRLCTKYFSSFKELILYDNYTECDNCEDLNFLLCRNGERTIGTAIPIELPKSLLPDRGFDKCCYNNIVLADLSDFDPYKNDFNGFFFKRLTPNSSVNFILIRLSDFSEYNLNDATYGNFVDFGENQPDLSYYVVDWRKVLSLLGVGTYQIKKELTIAGITVDVLSNTFNLQEFSIDAADKTVRFDSYMNGKLIHIDTDFSNSGYKTSLRVPGFFGRADYSYEEDRISQRNYRYNQNTMNRSTEYQYQAELIPECITSELWDFIFFGDEIQISDYNKNNHSYKYDRISVKLEDNGGTEFSSLTRNATINLSFSNRIENNRKINC